MSAENTKVARPATPNLDLLAALTDEVYLPIAHQKLASEGQVAGSQDELVKALNIGANVAQAVTQKAASARQVNPLDAHAEKVAAMLGMGPTQEQMQVAEINQINQAISGQPTLAAKFAAALTPAA